MKYFSVVIHSYKPFNSWHTKSGIEGENRFSPIISWCLEKTSCSGELDLLHEHGKVVMEHLVDHLCSLQKPQFESHWFMGFLAFDFTKLLVVLPWP